MLDGGELLLYSNKLYKYVIRRKNGVHYDFVILKICRLISHRYTSRYNVCAFMSECMYIMNVYPYTIFIKKMSSKKTKAVGIIYPSKTGYSKLRVCLRRRGLRRLGRYVKRGEPLAHD